MSFGGFTGGGRSMRSAGRGLTSVREIDAGTTGGASRPRCSLPRLLLLRLQGVFLALVDLRVARVHPGFTAIPDQEELVLVGLLLLVALVDDVVDAAVPELRCVHHPVDAEVILA